jgi:hypothetical protein
MRISCLPIDGRLSIPGALSRRGLVAIRVLLPLGYADYSEYARRFTPLRAPLCVRYTLKPVGLAFDSSRDLGVQIGGGS